MLTGNIVAHGIGVRDLFYGVPDLNNYDFVGPFTEETETTYKVQLKFRHKVTGKEFDVLLMPDNF